MKKLSFDYLDPQQQDVVRHTQGFSFVFGYSGSGKTRVMAEKIMHLISQGVDPSNILAISPTRRSFEMLKSLLSGHEFGCERIKTLNEMCAKILRKDTSGTIKRGRLSLYNTGDRIGLLLMILKKRNQPKEDRLPLIDILLEISCAKAKHAGLISKRTSSQAIDGLYEEALQKNRAIDHDDLVPLCVDLLERDDSIFKNIQNQYQHILIDEYHESHDLDRELIAMLASGAKSVVVFSDESVPFPRFSLSTFDGSRQFSAEKPVKIIHFKNKYQSTGCIINLEKDLIVTQIKKLKSEGVPLSDIAVLYASRIQSRTIEEGLDAQKIKYRLLGGPELFERMEIKDILAYMKFMVNFRDSVSFTRIMNRLSVKISSSIKSEVIAYAQSKDFDYLKVISDEYFLSTLPIDVKESFLSLHKNFLSIFKKLLHPRLGGLKKNFLESSFSLGFLSPKEFILTPTIILDAILKDTSLVDFYCKKNNKTYESIGKFEGFVKKYVDVNNKTTTLQLIEEIALGHDLENCFYHSQV